MTDLAAASLTFRYATPGDVASIRTLIERAYRGDEARATWTNEAGLLGGPRTSEAEIGRLVTGADTRFVLMEEDGRLVGCALIERREDSGYFGMLAIDPKRQAGGLGKALMARLEAAVRELWNVSTITLTVISARTELMAYYERRGYRASGKRVPFPFGETTGEFRNDFDLVEMQKPIP